MAAVHTRVLRLQCCIVAHPPDGAQFFVRFVAFHRTTIVTEFVVYLDVGVDSKDDTAYVEFPGGCSVPLGPLQSRASGCRSESTQEHEEFKDSKKTTHASKETSFSLHLRPAPESLRQDTDEDKCAYIHWLAIAGCRSRASLHQPRGS